ncbi:MAG: alpha/beta hydrolase [Oculatellaceae cyanobacterium Prado106]|jgi:predicted dienelactone hydrolase|nr:alpha/beta hydrolase [Oculatellaceae cyanobacterium Prado106]
MPYRTFFLSLLTTLLLALPARAAERVLFSYGPFEFSVAVADLDRFAREGTVSKDLGFILNRFSPERQAQVRALLKLRHQVDPVVVSRVTYSSTGERLLKRLGQMIQTEDRQNGLYAIRGAVLLSASDPEGLTVNNFLRKFPTNARLDIVKVLDFVDELTGIIRDTDRFMAELQQQSTIAAKAESPTETTPFADLTQPGEFGVAMQTLNWRDETRDRPIPIDLYRPETTTPSPVIILSGGLGARREHYAYLAEHLASHGYVAVVVEHVGSNFERQRDFFRGLYSENFDAAEFIDRPRDITFVLDELERLNASDFNGQLNLQQVGMYGYSFGATTALALAGAEINFEQVEQDCSGEVNVINISVLYQCRALELPRQRYDLQDDRIKAAFLFVPFGNSIYGQQALNRVQIPIFWQATNEDVVTPLIMEQIPLYERLPSPDKYLVVSKGLPHTRVILGLLDRVTNGNRVQMADQLALVTQRYLESFSLAFFQVYITQDESYRRYLQASYAEALTQQPYSLGFVQD